MVTSSRDPTIVRRTISNRAKRTYFESGVMQALLIVRLTLGVEGTDAKDLPAVSVSAPGCWATR
jgi:hypothetical protein